MDRLRQGLFGRGGKRFYQEFHALQDVSFEIQRGEAVAIVGRNGAGKSTLLQILSGVITPTDGVVSTSGKIAPLLELGTSFNPEFTGRENIGLAASVLGLSDREIKERESEIVAFADIGAHISQPLRTYSSGMYARLAFAVAAHVDAEILIVDEILAVGDIRFTQKCMAYIREFKKRGTLLFVSHDLGTVRAVCDRAIWLDAGKIVEDALAANVIRYYQTFMAGAPAIDAHSFLADLKRDDEVSKLAQARAAAVERENLPALDTPHAVASVRRFDPTSRSTGARDAVFVGAYWLNELGEKIVQLKGGEIVALELEIAAVKEISHPIVGFSVHDRLGQTIFAWDTSRTPDSKLSEFARDQGTAVRFTFRFPYLAGGTYSLVLALADGSPEANLQQHWMFDALTFNVEWSTIANGIIGVPILSIEARPLGQMTSEKA